MAEVDEFRDRFEREGYLRLPGLLPPARLSALQVELRRLQALARRRDFTMACTDHSPRHMSTVGGHLIAAESTLIPRLYTDPELIGLLRRVTGLDVVIVPDLLERHVINVLHRQGDTHGSHVDDYPLALVLFAEAPPSPRDGGLLEYVAHADTLDDLATPRARRAHHRTGEAYLLRSDTTAHRVTPLRRPGLRRVVLNLAYTTSDTRTAETLSAALLYR